MTKQIADEVSLRILTELSMGERILVSCAFACLETAFEQDEEAFKRRFGTVAHEVISGFMREPKG